VGDAFFCCHASILSVLATPTWIATYRKTLYVKSPKGMERFFSFQNIHMSVLPLFGMNMGKDGLYKFVSPI
jgi:hypothetical protein